MAGINKPHRLSLLCILLSFCITLSFSPVSAIACDGSPSPNCGCGPSCKCGNCDCGGSGCDAGCNCSDGHGGNQGGNNGNGAGGGTGIDILDELLIGQLVQSGLNYTLSDIVMIVIEPDNGLMWLERGDSLSGLTHILQNHEAQFASCGVIGEEAIVELLYTILSQSGGTQANNGNGGPAKTYWYGGRDWLVAYGTNGYIVSFYPYSSGS